jgi:cyclophilin family peptidyl-prolyl cis-trans isomerase
MLYKSLKPKAFNKILSITYLLLATGMLALSSSNTYTKENPKIEIATNMGNIRLTLLPEHAPLTVANFLQLVKERHYDGLIFHRVIANFMIQAGGYTNELEYRDSEKIVKNESNNGLPNTRGTIAMARTSDPDSASAQFYINVKDNKHLDYKDQTPGYTVFGFVTKGMEVIEKIELVDTHIKNGMPAVPEEPIVIISIRGI